MYACICMANTYTCAQTANTHTCVCIANTSAGNATFCADSRAGFAAHGIVIPNCIVKALRQFCHTVAYFTNVELLYSSTVALSIAIACILGDCKITLTLSYQAQFHMKILC